MLLALLPLLYCETALLKSELDANFELDEVVVSDKLLGFRDKLSLLEVVDVPELLKALLLAESIADMEFVEPSEGLPVLRLTEVLVLSKLGEMYELEVAIIDDSLDVTEFIEVVDCPVENDGVRSDELLKLRFVLKLLELEAIKEELELVKEAILRELLELPEDRECTKVLDMNEELRVFDTGKLLNSEEIRRPVGYTELVSELVLGETDTLLTLNKVSVTDELGKSSAELEVDE